MADKKTRKDVEDLIAAAGQQKFGFGDPRMKVSVNLHGADLSGEDLSELDLTGANFHGADLSGTDLTGTKLRGANFHGADLSDAVLDDAELDEANLHGANLGSTSCDKASFKKCNLSGANFDKAAGIDLKGKMTEGANKYNAVDVDGKTFDPKKK